MKIQGKDAGFTARSLPGFASWPAWPLLQLPLRRLLGTRKYTDDHHGGQLMTVPHVCPTLLYQVIESGCLHRLAFLRI